MTAEKDKADPSAPGGKPAGKTVVGVPALSDRPSDLELTRERQPQADDEQPTAIAVKTLTMDDAERVLADRSPSVAGAIPPRATAGPMHKTPPLGHEMFPGLGRQTARGLEPERPTRAGVAQQAGTAPKGRSTLLLDGSAPPVVSGDPNGEGPPIVVPTSSIATAPKAVTQPPPWSEGAAHVGIPQGAPPPRAREPSIEEISSSMLLPADASGQMSPSGVEELSGSVLIEDALEAGGPPVVTHVHAPSATPRPASVKPPVPSSAPPGRPASIKPPVPTSPSTRPAVNAHRTLLGMPELPKTTPAPRLDYLPGASGSQGPVPIPVPAPVDPFAGVPPAPGAELFASGPPAAAPMPPPAEGPAHVGPMTGDIELTRLPRSPLQQAIEKMRALVQRASQALPENTVLRSQANAPWFLPAVAVAGLVVGVGLVGLVVSAIRGTNHASDRDTPGPSATARASGMAVIPGPSTTAPLTTPPPIAPALPPCTLVGAPHVVAPSAIVAAGVEVGLAGNDLALGFAPSEHDAMVVRVDPASLSASSTVKARSHDSIRRVTPMLPPRGSLSAAIDTDRKGDKLQGRRTVRSAPPAQLGATSDGHLSWARVGGAPAGQLWALPDATATIDALRGATDVSGDPTVAVAFRRGGAVWMGTLGGTATGGLSPSGELSKVDGLGTAIGSPAVAISGSVVLVAWADRASSDQPWGLRWTRFDAGSASGDARTFSPPPGGKGPPIMSPALAAVPGGRFLLVWTEGPASGHAVRALTLAPDGSALGAPLDLSVGDANAGQAQAAVNADGAGVVAFLESSGSGFEVAASSIACGKP